jgi:CRP-like cAMP-binding protein
MPDNIQPAEVSFAKGSSILLEGKPNTSKFYIIKEGNVQITRETDSIMPRENNAGPGEMLGVVSVMASRNYIESVVALTDVVLMAVEQNQIIRNASLAMNIIKQFSKRLRKLNEIFSKRVIMKSTSDDPSNILEIAAFYEKSKKYNQALYAYEQYLVYCPNGVHKKNVEERAAKIKTAISATRPDYSPDTMKQKWAKDNLLFVEGEAGHNLYIIQEGSVKITKIANNNEVVLAILKKGDVVGEMAMLEDKPRAATAEINENCTLLSVNQHNFTNLVKEQPDMVIRLIALMADRIWYRYRQLTNTMIENPLGRIYDALLIQLEKKRINLTETNSYLCDFSFKELVGMAGMTDINIDDLYNKVYTSRRVTMENNKVHILNIASIIKEAEYYRRAREMGKDLRDKI